jgi:hypothetical protein
VITGNPACPHTTYGNQFQPCGSFQRKPMTSVHPQHIYQIDANAKLATASLLIRALGVASFIITSKPPPERRGPAAVKPTCGGFAPQAIEPPNDKESIPHAPLARVYRAREDKPAEHAG